MAFWSHTAVSSNDSELLVSMVDECRKLCGPDRLGLVCTILLGTGGAILRLAYVRYKLLDLPRDLRMCASDGPGGTKGYVGLRLGGF